MEDLTILEKLISKREYLSKEITGVATIEAMSALAEAFNLGVEATARHLKYDGDMSAVKYDRHKLRLP